MHISFHSAAEDSAPRLLALVVAQDALPTGLERAVAEGAAAARFTGKTGQVFEAFVERGGDLVRLALVGAGAVGAEDEAARAAALERAGAALAARYLTAGEPALALDAAASRLDARGLASVLLGLRLRAWRYDAYRTRLKDEQKISLKDIVVLDAPDGAEAEWRAAAALAEGVEF